MTRARLGRQRGDVPASRARRARTDPNAPRLASAIGNRAFTRLVQRQEAPAAVPGVRDPDTLGAIAAQPDMTVAPTEAGSLDAEGNSIGTAAGKEYVSSFGPAGPQVPHRGVPLPAAYPANPRATYTDLKAHCEAARDEQQGYANSLRGDMKYWFAKVYFYVTQGVIDSAEAGRYAYPIAVLQDVLAFHATYRTNLGAWRSGNVGAVESNWRRAFREAASLDDGSWYRTRSEEILSALLPSMEAHIRFDLPRAIASVYETRYAGLPGVDMSIFHSDFDLMAPIFEAASAQVLPEIKRECSLIDPGRYQALQDIGFPFIFLIASERDQAFEKAHTIVSGHERGVDTQAGMQDRLEAYNRGAHPLQGDDAFSISTSWGNGEIWAAKISDYDWNAQPE